MQVERSRSMGGMLRAKPVAPSSAAEMITSVLVVMFVTPGTRRLLPGAPVAHHSP